MFQCFVLHASETLSLLFEVGHVAGEVLVVGCHVDKAVTGKAEQDGLFLSRFLALERFGDGGCDGMA